MNFITILAFLIIIIIIISVVVVVITVTNIHYCMNSFRCEQFFLWKSDEELKKQQKLVYTLTCNIKNKDISNTFMKMLLGEFWSLISLVLFNFKLIRLPKLSRRAVKTSEKSIQFSPTDCISLAFITLDPLIQSKS